LGILLLYNTSLVYSWEELVQNTGLSPEVLSGQIGILVKAKVLISEGPGATLNKYTLNLDFKFKKIRVNLNIGIKSEQKQESDETHKTIEEDRKLLIQVFLFNPGCHCTYYENAQGVKACCSNARSHYATPISI
jgi:cullin 1